jgi:hypothetical protein
MKMKIYLFDDDLCFILIDNNHSKWRRYWCRCICSNDIIRLF